MREIKFRAWFKGSSDKAPRMLHPTTKRYEPGLVGINWADNGFVVDPINGSYSFDQIELMQYTGLKDKNGKEIYEGDVIKTRWGGVGEVIFSDGAFELLVEDGQVHNVLNTLQVSERALEVIGNVYENPEILK